MLERKIHEYLEDFFVSHKEALLITGARQVGKSYSIRKYGKSHFSSFIEINFLENKNAVEAFKTAKDSHDLLLRISVLTKEKLIKGNTLIFLDEIQVLPDAITPIKFLVEEGSYRYVLSGSLLGTKLSGIQSVPVGYMVLKEMYPLDLEEFYTALGVKKEIIDYLYRCFRDRISVDPVIHDKMMEIFNLYLIVGGMPAVVEEYIRTNNIQNVVSKQKEIVALYKEDISQYDRDSKLYIEDIFDLIPAELNNQNKRFILKNLNENIKFSRYENSFIWLRNAGVAIPVYNVENPKLPLELSKLRNLFKLFSNDVGLLASQYADGIQIKILNNDKKINCGAIYENFVAEELLSHGFSLYYFNSKKQGELDFVVRLNDVVLPIEVKSGKYYTRHNALTNVVKNEEYNVDSAYVLCCDNVLQKGNIIYLPIYMTMFIKERQLDSLIYQINLSSIQ